MKHSVYIGGKHFPNNSEIAFTHVVIGQRDRSKEAVEVPKPLKLTASPEEKEAHEKLVVERAGFVRDEAQGRFAMKPLEWIEGEEAAVLKSAEWETKGWINVSVKPVHTTNENA